MSSVPSSSLGIVASLLDGSLKPETTIISDSVVQPGLSLFREIAAQAVKRQDERVCLLLTENDPQKILGDEVSLAGGEGRASQSNLTIVDCFNEPGGTEEVANGLVQCIDIEDLSGIRSCVESCCPTILLVDSLNTLEAFNGSSSSYRLLKSILASDKDQSTSIIALHHTDVPSSPGPSTSSALPLLPTLLSPSFTSALLHIRLHTPSLFAHLYYAYGIEQVGQDDTQDVDSRVYDFLPLLHGRHWGSPLHSSGTSGESTIDDLDIGAYDSPNPRDVCLGLLDVVPTLNSAGRCVAEYSMRGIAKNRRRSEAAKIVRGLEGLKTVLDEKSKSSQVTPTAKVADVLRIKLRRLEADKKPVDANKVTEPTAAAAGMFNLSLTDRQREARESVALPYTPREAGEIIYQPDSADDMDESDPDEDLDL